MPIQIPEFIKIDLFNQHLSQIREYLFGYHLDCFISYSWGNNDHKKKVARLAEHLTKAGMSIFLDLRNNSKINSSIMKFIDKISSVKYVVLAGSKMLMQKYSNQTDCVLNKEIAKIHHKFRSNSGTVIGISLQDNFENCLPDFLKDKIRGHYTNDFDVYAKVTLDLLEYFAPIIIKQNVKIIIENFNNVILAIKYNISYKSLLEHQSMNSLQLIDKISIDVDDLLKKNYLKMFNSESLFNTKVNFFKSHVYLVYQNND